MDIETQPLTHEERQTKALESLLKIAIFQMWVFGFALFVALVVAYILAVQ